MDSTPHAKGNAWQKAATVPFFIDKRQYYIYNRDVKILLLLIMFSANENIQLRKYKQRVVEYVESCIPEEALDMGTVVMAMQVSCKAPGCVPLETAIVIVFPKLNDEELIPGLPESRGGNYKTKVLKPMAEVTKDDILESLPPEFPGGKRSMEKLCIQARDVMLGQITQLFAEDDADGRRLMAQYLQECLTEYTDRGCVPPGWGEPFPPRENHDTGEETPKKTERNAGEAKPKLEAKTKLEADTESVPAPGVTSSGNFVFKRPKEDDSIASGGRLSYLPSFSSSTPANNRHSASSSFSDPSKQSTNTPAVEITKQKGTTNNSQNIMVQLGERQHAPGIRRPGCPCCDPDNANNLIDEMMAL